MIKVFIIIMCGLQCSGKSTLSKMLSKALGIIRISTDDVSVKLLDNPGILNAQPLERYMVYYHTIKQAEEILVRGQSVIIDGTFSTKTFRQSAYFAAEKAGAAPYLIHCECKNWGVIQQRYERRQEQKRNNQHLFDEWTTIEPFKKLFQEFERPDREAMPDGTPVPIIHYDSELSKAEILFSDGSDSIMEILEAMKQ